MPYNIIYTIILYYMNILRNPLNRPDNTVLEKHLNPSYKEAFILSITHDISHRTQVH